MISDLPTDANTARALPILAGKKSLIVGVAIGAGAAVAAVAAVAAMLCSDAARALTGNLTDADAGRPIIG